MEKKTKKERDIVLELDGSMKDIRQQLSEQLKCLENRLDTEVSILGELQDFFRRRSEIELEYSRSLDKLVKQVMVRHKAEKQRREHWPLFSTYTCWQRLLAFTKKESKDRHLLSDIYSNQMALRLSDLAEDSTRIFRNCREIGSEIHEEIVKVLSELQSAMKTYHIYHTESKQAEAKLRSAEGQKMKVEQHSVKGIASRKLRAVEKETEKRQLKYQENKLRSLKSRNEYLLCIDAANAAIHKYFVDDLPDLIDGIGHGYHNTIQRSMLMFLSCEEGLKKSLQNRIVMMNKCITDLDARTDKQHFLESNSTTFSLPKKFEFQPHKGDEICQISAQKSVQDELIQRFESMNNRLSQLKLEIDETWKSLEEAEKSLMSLINAKDYEVTDLFTESQVPPKSPCDRDKRHKSRLELENYYIGKFRAYILNSNLIARLAVKKNSIQKALGEGALSKTSRPPSLPPKPRKRRIGKAPLVGQPKLFGGSLEEYIEATNQEIPPVIKSCVQVINLYGMHHMGVFRVSGALPEINEFKAAFERGEEPLLDINDGNCINSVAGVLKLFFRQLREPLFPLQLFDALIDCAKLESANESVERLRELILSLPRNIVVVMRYLFAFLNHVSEFSDENMMDPFNLAVCFGPTLLPIPGDKDQVTYQSHVNDLIKFIIVHHEDIFPQDGGIIYQRCITEYEGDREDGSDEEDGGGLSEDEPEVIEAIAQYDFEGRTNRELSFKKGDVLVIFGQVNDDWWEGAFQGCEGLIPDAYVTLKQKEESCGSTGDDEMCQSTDSLPFKTLTAESNNHKASSQLNVLTSDTDKDETELSQELENALAEVAEVMEGLERKPSPHSKHTPDLVLDLPKSTEDQSDLEDAFPTDVDTFSMHDQTTPKKAGTMPRSTTHAVSFQQTFVTTIKRSSSTNATMSACEGRPGYTYEMPVEDSAFKKDQRSPSVEQLRKAIAPIMEQKMTPTMTRIKPPVMKKPAKPPESTPKPEKQGDGSTAL